jgi:aldehyde:ferredoxin oxidoreductase
MSNAGTILIIDLSARTIERIATSGYAKEFIGGAGVAARLFTECVPSDTRAFDEKNMLIFSTGPLTGSLFGNKANVCSRAPEQPNHPYVHCGMGGQLPSEMKFAGYDHIVIKGQSEKPVYLSIYNEDVRFVDAGALWGLDVYKTQAAIRSECQDPDVRVACIGPAGENRIVNALILHDIEHTAARGGMGAVMGAKKLKALAVRGTKGLQVADPKAVRKLWQEYFDYYTKGKGRLYYQTWQRGGLARHVVDGYRYRRRKESGVYTDEIKEMLSKYMVGSLGCSFCPLQCHINYNMPGIGSGGATCSNHGMLSGFPDQQVWWAVTNSIHKYGMESFAVWSMLLWLQGMYQSGLITLQDLDGIEMDKYAVEPFTAAVGKICRREGFGEWFAEGLGKAAQKIAGGKGFKTLDWVIQSRNRPSFSMHDLAYRGFAETGKAIRYRAGDIIAHPYSFDNYCNIEIYAEATGQSIEETERMINDWSADGVKKWLGDDADGSLWRQDVYDVRQSQLTVISEDLNMICDLSGHCEMPSEREIHYGCFGGFEETAGWISALSGKKCTVEELRQAAQKTRTLVDAYNSLCFLTHKELRPEAADMPPKDAIHDKFLKKIKVDKAKLREIGDAYCKSRGYDPETGIPTAETLTKMDLDDMAVQLAQKLQESKDWLKPEERETGFPDVRAK